MVISTWLCAIVRLQLQVWRRQLEALSRCVSPIPPAAYGCLFIRAFTLTTACEGALFHTAAVDSTTATTTIDTAATTTTAASTTAAPASSSSSSGCLPIVYPLCIPSSSSYTALTAAAAAAATGPLHRVIRSTRLLLIDQLKAQLRAQFNRCTHAATTATLVTAAG